MGIYLKKRFMFEKFFSKESEVVEKKEMQMEAKTLKDIIEFVKEKKILIVEDSPRNMRKEALEFLFSLTSSEYVTLASTLEEAVAIIDGAGAEIVLTDLFFPSKKGQAEEPNGLKILDIASKKGKLVGICSDVSHHQQGQAKSIIDDLEKKFSKTNGGSVLFTEGRLIRAGYEEEDGGFTPDEDESWRGDKSKLIKDWGKLLVNLVIYSPTGPYGAGIYRTRDSIPK